MTIPPREPYELAEGMKQGDKILLHVCCAPCSCEIIEGIIETGLDLTVFFYNPNIHPQKEYEVRKDEVLHFCAAHDIASVDADYDTDNWFARVKGLENEPERGKRCTQCFEMRMERAAFFAHENGIPFFGTSLSISRHKTQSQVHEAGHHAAALYDDVKFWDYNWRKKGGTDRGMALAKKEGFYRQNYCGCAYSLKNRIKKDR